MENQPVSLASLQRALSEERLQAYAIQGDTDSLDAVARYIWNLALSAAMQPALHALEITFRNHLFENSVRIVNEASLAFREVECWLDADPSLLEDNELQTVEDAKEVLRRSRKPLTAGRLIARLGFGFWVSLCKRPYEQGRTSGPALWPGILKSAFPFLEKPKRTRSQIFHRMDELRELRNRVSHHEPIWDHDMLEAHSKILETIGWINLSFSRAIATVSPVETVVKEGHLAFRDTASKLVKL